jgi:MoaA/NifB/PqqE/SkfB family radical SAM enzyme
MFIKTGDEVFEKTTNDIYKRLNIIAIIQFTKRYMKTKKYFPFVVETHLADHCNLVCKGCSHFSSLITQKHFTNLAIFKRDFLQMKTLFNDLYEIRLMGGEPLLHPSIIDFIEFSRKTFPLAKISIYTNVYVFR